ncbi:ATP-binding protein [Microvirga sp. CF3062]|uniref:ATP-binding protein n=1 Tax=Microvirga sp. CF3062 TaxID=3110182 RepID=UPI002E764987|nr:ATP-binding protein [Microvirga sp. CF3062]MEE1656482.1 ATP-binding protein [Microvirga sp. CF3062]
MIGDFLETEEERQQAAFKAAMGMMASNANYHRPQPPTVADIPFVETTVSRLIFAVFDRVWRTGRNGLVIGAAGVGKTKTLREIVRRSEHLEGPEAALITITGVIGASVMAIFEEMCPHLGVQPATSIAATLRRLSKQAMFRPVVIIDEAQNLTLKAARELLHISEEAQVRMMFCGNDEVLKLVNSGQAAIQQIGRRLPIRETVSCILDDDTDLLARSFGIKDDDAFALCRAVGEAFHADGVVTLLQEARSQAGDKGVIRIEHLKASLNLFPQFQAALTGQGRRKLIARS